MSNDEECKTCGRPDKGHWLGCAETAHSVESIVHNTAPAESVTDHCAFGECTEPRRSADKRVKFCETHSDPKNRK